MHQRPVRSDIHVLFGLRCSRRDAVRLVAVILACGPIDVAAVGILAAAVAAGTGGKDEDQEKDQRETHVGVPPGEGEWHPDHMEARFPS